MLIFLFNIICLCAWETYFTGQPNLTLSSYLTPETISIGNYYLENAIAINFIDGVIYMRDEKADANLLIEDSFFFNCMKSYAGGIAYLSTGGSLIVQKSCCILCSTMTVTYTGATFYTQVSGNVTTDMVTYYQCSNNKYISLSTVAFKGSYVYVENINNTQCHSTAGAFDPITHGYIQYSNFDGTNCTEPTQVYLIFVSLTDVSYCNILKSNFEIPTAVTALYCCRSTEDVLVSNACFANNIVDYVTYYYRKAGQTFKFRMVDCYVDRGYVECRDTINIMSLASSHEFTFLSSFDCQAAYTPSEDNRVQQAVKTAAIVGGSVGGGILIAVGIWLGKKLFCAGASKAISTAVYHSDDDSEYTYTTYTAESESKDPEKPKEESDIKDESGTNQEITNKNEHKKDDAANNNESSEHGDVSIDNFSD